MLQETPVYLSVMVSWSESKTEFLTTIMSSPSPLEDVIRLLISNTLMGLARKVVLWSLSGVTNPFSVTLLALIIASSIPTCPLRTLVLMNVMRNL